MRPLRAARLWSALPWFVALAVAGSCKAREATPGGPATSSDGRAPGAPPSSSAPTAPAPPPGTLRYRVSDAASGAPIPCKLTFVATPPHPPPFGNGDVPLVMGDAVAGAGRVFSLSGEGALDVPKGRYEVVITRGPEWTLERREVVVSDAPSTLEASLTHVIDTTGWLSGDFHVHAEPSWDSSVPLAARVREFAAEGVDLLVATDHNLVTDYAPVIAELHAEALLASIPGSELTTHAWGHFGAFPLGADARSWPVMRGTMIQDGTAKSVLGDARARAPDVFLTANHPRLPGMGYFDIGELDRRTGKLVREGATDAIDALEVLNGYQDPDEAILDTLMADWLSLLDAGNRVAGLGNSDTHHLSNNLAGYPRNYLALADDRPAAVRAEAVTGALRAGKVLFTTGPFVRLSVEGAGLGETAVVGPKARGHLAVDAAPWVDVTRVTLYLGSRITQRWAVPPGTATRRFEVDFTVDGTKPTYVLARVEGTRSLGPSVGEEGQFTVRPVAVTNPVYLRPRAAK